MQFSGVQIALLGLALLPRPLMADAPPQPGRALLIGCTKYDHLSPALSLQGPGNDVALMRDLLRQRFGFRDDRIVLLTESIGRPEYRPTRANIEREFLRLGREALPNEPVVIFLAGHGSQQPDQNPNPQDPEPDGLDELFLPADIRGWDGKTGHVPNAIVDDELHDWLSRIERRGAVVTIIVDACCSGSMARGAGERIRMIPPDGLIPEAALQKATAQAAKIPVGQVRGHRRESLLDTSTVVAIYASQASEPTVERLLPAHGADQKPHGLLTYTISQILMRSTEPMTCREVVRRVQSQYAGWGRLSPTPMIEGRERDREVFGLTVWPEPTGITLSKAASGWKINAGVLLGVTQDSILAVASPSDRKPAGHVRVQVARTMDADVIPCTPDGQPATTLLPDQASCVVVRVDPGELLIKVAVVEDSDADSDWKIRVRSWLSPEQLAAHDVRLVQRVETAAEADWLIRIGKRELILVPANDPQADMRVPIQLSPGSIGPRLLDDSVEKWISPTLLRIARAANLKRLAIDANSHAPVDVVRFQVTIESLAGREPGDDGRRMRFSHGEKASVTVKNDGEIPLDMTLLYIDSEAEISALYPGQGEINRLQPGETLTVPVMVVAPKAGLEHLVAIVVKGEREVIDFSCLALPAISSTALRGSAEETLSSPLGQMLSRAVFAETLRGSKRASARPYSMKLLSWEVQP